MRALLFAADRALTRVAQPIKAAAYRRRTEPFIQRARNGLLFELYPNEEVDEHIARYGIYDRRHLDYFATLIPHGAVFVDIGANIGNHALYLGRKCSAVYCFEPNPRAYRRLERNIALNHAGNVTIHRFGLGDHDAVQRFDDGGQLGMAHFSDDGALALHIRKGDEAIHLDRIDLIKIDVEGMEASVFRGLAGTIATHQPIVAFEYSGHVTPETDWKDIQRSLKGYRIFEPHFTLGLKGLALAGKPRLVEVSAPEKRWYACLLAFPEAAKS